MDSNINTDNNL